MKGKVNIAFIRFMLVSLILAVLGLKATAQDAALKTNLIYWGGITPNIGIEFAFSPKVTMDVSGAYNPWTFKDNKKMRFWLVQPEVRYWLCEKFEGHFIGIHAHGAQYFGGFKDKRYDGYLAGGGVSWGYDWILSPHWNLEVTAGVGYARLWYKQSERIPCIKCYEHRHKDYIGPTKLGVTFIYIF